jgi:hypothetical protein
MRKAILASVILSAMFSAAQAADVKLSGDFGYRNDDLEVGSVNSNRDRLRLQLNATADVNDKTKVVFGVRTGSTKSSWNDIGEGNSLKNVGLNLAYVEYAAAPFAKVTLGKMNRPWHSDALFFDNDIKPEGLAVAVKHDSGLSASAFNLKLVEGGVAKDSDLVGLQVGLSKKLAGLDVAAHATTLKQEVKVGNALVKHDQLVLGASLKKDVAGVPVKLFVEQLTNDEAKTQDKATAYGVTFGNAKKAGDWEVSLLKQDAEANALSAVWTDSDFGGEATLHDGTAIRAAYGLADGWKVRGSLFDVEVGATKADYKRLMVDLVFVY